MRLSEASKGRGRRFGHVLIVVVVLFYRHTVHVDIFALVTAVVCAIVRGVIGRVICALEPRVVVVLVIIEIVLIFLVVLLVCHPAMPAVLGSLVRERVVRLSWSKAQVCICGSAQGVCRLCLDGC